MARQPGVMWAICAEGRVKFVSGGVSQPGVHVAFGLDKEGNLVLCGPYAEGRV